MATESATMERRPTRWLAHFDEPQDDPNYLAQVYLIGGAGVYSRRPSAICTYASRATPWPQHALRAPGIVPRHPSWPSGVCGLPQWPHARPGSSETSRRLSQYRHNPVASRSILWPRHRLVAAMPTHQANTGAVPAICARHSVGMRLPIHGSGDAEAPRLPCRNHTEPIRAVGGLFSRGSGTILARLCR
jgi:hypothetical protein